VLATWRLVLANLRKGPWQTAGLAGFVTLAALMANLGLMFTMVYPHALDDQARAAGTPWLSVFEPDGSYSDAQVSWLLDQPGVDAVEHADVLVPDKTTVRFHDGPEDKVQAFVADADAASGREAVRLHDGGKPLTDDGVWLPYLYEVVYGWQVGDEFTFDFGSSVVRLQVCGFTDEIPFGSYGNVWHRFYVASSTYGQLADELPRWAHLKVYTDTPERADTLMYEVLDQFDGVNVFSYTPTKEDRLFMARVLATVILAFSIVVVAVSLLVVRFRVVASIEESMSNIGTLKALGYTSGQIAGSLLGQFGLVTLVGSAAGVAGSYAVLPLVAGRLEAQSAVVWTPGFAPLPALAAVAVVAGTALAVTGVVVVRIRRLGALTSLRTGLTVHSFKHNRFPLDRTAGPLTWLLAAKSAVAAKAQTVTIGLVVAGVTVMGTVTAATYENIGADPANLVDVIGVELPDVHADGDPEAIAELQVDLASRDGVRALFAYTDGIPLPDSSWPVVSTDDFSVTEGHMLCQGRWPQHANEVAVNWQLARTNGRGIGDTWGFIIDGTVQEYLVTGLIQTVESTQTVALTTDGVRRLLPDHQHDMLYVYLDDPADADAVAADIRRGWADRGVHASTDAKTMTARMAPFGPVVSTVTAVVLAVSVTIIVLVVSLVMSMAVRRSRRRFGVQKAVGFTNRQLVAQTTATYLPTVAVGAAVGSTVGCYAFPPFMDALFRTMDIYTTAMRTSAGTTAVLVVALVALGLAAALAATARIRRITPYSLVTE